jgi:hypothetical protein
MAIDMRVNFCDFSLAAAVRNPFINTVTYVRFPWLNNVSTAVTMDSTTLLHFLSNATMETDISMLHVTFP